MNNAESTGREWISPQACLGKNNTLRLKRRGGLCLLIDPDSASWLVLPPLYFDFWKKLPQACSWRQVLEIEHPFSPQKRSEVTQELYRQNMLTVNGRLYCDPVETFKTPKKYPDFICFHITEACNLACRYCLADSVPTNKAMPLEVYKFAIRKVLTELPNDTFTIDFHGGEPLLALDKIVEAVNYAENLNKEEKLGKKLLYSFQTNGTLLNDKNIEILKSIPRLQFGVSLDGPKSVHDKNRIFAGRQNGERGSFDVIVRNLMRAKELGLRPGVLGVIHDPDDYLTSFRFFTEELGLREFRLNYSSYIGRSAKLLDFPLNRNEKFAENWLRMVDCAYEFAKAHDVHLRISDIDNQINNLIFKRRPFMCYRSPCGAGNSVFGFAIDGGIHACEELASSGFLRLANIYDPGLNLKELIDCSPQVAELNSRCVNNIPKCRRCMFKRFCTGGCTSKTLSFFGTIMRESPMCSYYAKVFEGLMWRLYEHPDMTGYLGPENCRKGQWKPSFKDEA